MRGSCLCGGVTFELTEGFERMTFCHCTNCKKLSGGVGTANGRVPSEAIIVLSGEDLLTRFQPAEGTAKTFCARCGSNLFGGGWPEAERASVRLSAIETPIEGKPDAHIFVRSVASWETLPDDGAERFDVRAD